MYAVIAGVVVLAGVVTALLIGLGGGDPPDPAGEVAGSGTVAEQVSPEAAVPEAEPAAPPAAEPVVLEFNDGLGEGWTWENEDAEAWSVEGGAVRIEVQESPPLRNVVLRELPAGDVSVLTELIFDPDAPGHAAGLVLAGEDLGDRIELVWTTDGLAFTGYEGGRETFGGMAPIEEFRPGEWLDATLRFDITAGEVTAVFGSAAMADWDLDTVPLPEGITRVGMIAYSTGEAGGETAVFNRFVIE